MKEVDQVEAKILLMSGACINVKDGSEYGRWTNTYYTVVDGNLVEEYRPCAELKAYTASTQSDMVVKPDTLHNLDSLIDTALREVKTPDGKSYPYRKYYV